MAKRRASSTHVASSPARGGSTKSVSSASKASVSSVAAAAATEETLAFDALDTLFVDPPRAGLDATCVELARRFATVVYVSCNPETLARDVALLAATHDVSRLAAFDQFPYTHHLEAGVVLERKS